MLIPARPHQTNCIDAVLRGFNEFNRQLVVMPTGSGKTITFAGVAERLQPRKTLILAHREELIDQAIAKVKMATGLQAEKEMAESSASHLAPVVVASIQTMSRRLYNWAPDHFGLVVCDESHHCISDSWQKVLLHFDGAWVLGVTATPDRGDKRNLGQYFENIAYEIGLLDLIHQGYLCQIVTETVPLKIDLTNVKQSAGDFDSNDLGHALTPYLGAIAHSIADKCAFRRTLVFLPLRATSRDFVEHCRDAGLVAEHIDGESPDRREILQRFASGQTEVLANAMLLTEGYDDCGIECVVVLRPTRSRPLYSQMCGRGTRIAPAKKNVLLLDFLWMHEKHSLIHPAHLIATNEDEAKAITEVLEAKAGQGELELESLANDVREQRESKLRDELERNRKRKAKYISADEFALNAHQHELVDWQPTMRWHEQPVTEKQAKCLKRAHIDIETVRGKGHASQLLSYWFSQQDLLPASEGTKWAMRNAGMPNANTATKNDERKFWAEKRKVEK